MFKLVIMDLKIDAENGACNWKLTNEGYVEENVLFVHQCHTLDALP